MGAGLSKQLSSPVHVVSAEHYVDMASSMLDLVTVLLGQTAPYRHLNLRALGLQCLEVAESSVELVVGVLPDAAGVEHDDVGLFHRSRWDHAFGLQQAGNPLAVVLVHLAPIGANGVGTLGR